MSTSPRLWPNPPSNSPLPLPTGPVFYTSSELQELEFPEMPDESSLDLESLQTYVGNFKLPNGILLKDVIDVTNRRPILVAGELANPYRLCDILAPDLPLIPVRLENICRTYSDNLDSREVQPGIHHVTIARSVGWWEISFIALVELPDMKKMVGWLDGPNTNTWAPKRLDEGIIRLENNMMLMSPEPEDISWDGDLENVNCDMPEANGPCLDLSTLIVPINTRQGCYNHRGRILRCKHYPQTEFHDNLFRRGSSFKWDKVLNCL